MNDHSFDPNEVREIYDALTSGTITHDQHRRLEAILENNHPAQAYYFSLLDLEQGLLAWAKQSPEPVPPVERNVYAREAKDPRERSQNVPRGTWQPLARTLVACAASFAIGIVGWNGYVSLKNRNYRSANDVLVNGDLSNDGSVASESKAQPTPGTADVAVSERIQLVQAAGAKLVNELLPRIGQTLRSGHEYALIEGMIQLKSPKGATAILRAPSVFEVLGPERLLVRIGQCSVHAPDGAEGFLVETPQTRVVDLGTRFNVEVNDTGETEVQVMEGAAEVQALLGINDSRATRVLDEREAVRFSAEASEPLVPVAFQGERYQADLPDRLVGFDAVRSAAGNADVLTGVTVQRNHVIRSIPADELVAARVVHFKAGANHHNRVRVRGESTDLPGSLAVDRILNNGFINPGGSKQSLRSSPVLEGSVDELTPGIAYEFERPVINGPGPDVVWIELQSIVDPTDGDSFHVSPIEFAPGLRSHTVTTYDITLASSAALPLAPFDLFHYSSPPTRANDLIDIRQERRIPALGFKAIAVGIDLTWLGYAEGDQVRGFMIQDDLKDSSIVDPVFVAGLPEFKAVEIQP